MRAFLTTPLFCMTLTIGTFLIGSAVSKRTGSPLANPLLLAAMQIWIFLSVTKTPVAQYYAGTEMIRFLIVPATAVLGVSIYKNLARIQKNLIPVLGGCAVGAVTAVTSIVLLCRAFGLSREITVALAPKSVTMAIATSVSEQYGGLVPLTVFGVVVTGS
ncbi:MAG: LrgB family protein, partial [Pygmaiobacter sp.]